MSGSAGQLRVPAEYLRGCLFPLPPKGEQRRIVARIDALFAEIAEGEAAIEDARKGLETFRRALLKAAVTGELTKDWREANPATETGHDLLARIKADLAEKGQTKARGKRAADASPLDTSTLRQLPEGWVWGTLGEIAEIVGGATVDKKRTPSDPVTVPYLRVANVQRGHVDLTEVKAITVERESAAKLRLQPGDLLLNEGGDRDKIGRGWVWDGANRRHDPPEPRLSRPPLRSRPKPVFCLPLRERVGPKVLHRRRQANDEPRLNQSFKGKHPASPDPATGGSR